MRFSERSGSIVQYKSMMGFTQVLLLLIALGLMALGIFDYINPEVFGFGNAAFVLIFIGGMVFILSVIAPLAELFHLSKFGTWIGAFFIISILVVFVVIISMMYEGGIVLG